MLRLLKAPTVLGGSYSRYKMLSQNSQRPRRANHHTFNGSCHCGNIHVVFTRPTRFQISTPTIQEPSIHGRDELTAIPARACGCSFCTKHRAAWTSNSRGSFQLNITEPSLVTQYRLGTKTADYHVCARCGIVPIVTCIIGGDIYAVINAYTLDGVCSEQLVVKNTDFEEETAESRLERWRRNWTPEAVERA
jgi:hypothetical protein